MVITFIVPALKYEVICLRYLKSIHRSLGKWQRVRSSERHIIVRILTGRNVLVQLRKYLILSDFEVPTNVKLAGVWLIY